MLQQRPAQQRSRRNLDFCLHTGLSPGSHLLRTPSSHLAPGLGHIDRQTFPRSDHLCGKFAVKFTNLLRPSDKVRKSLPCEFGLNLNGVVERPHTHELLYKGPALLQRLPGVVHVDIRNGLNADGTIVRGCSGGVRVLLRKGIGSSVKAVYASGQGYA